MSSQLSNTQKVIKGISSQTLVTIMLAVVEIISFSLMSRLLSRVDFGLFAAITAVTSIFASISEAGIGSALIQRKEMTDDYKNTSFTLSLIIGAVVALTLCFSSDFFAKAVVGEELKVPLMLMSITIFINGMLSVNYSWIRRKLQFLRAGLIQLTAMTFSTLIAVVLALKGYGVYAILSKAISSSLIALIISYFCVNTRFSFCLKKEYLKSIVHFGGWLTASVILRNIAHQVDKLMMSRLLSVSALGSYNRPKEFITRVSSQLNGIFDTALFPVLSGIQDNLKSLQNAFNRSQYYLNLFSMGLALAFICNADLIIRVFFGDKWFDLKPVFLILSLSLVFNINGRLGDCYLRSLALVRQQFFLRLLQLVLNVVGILIGYRYGIVGVATAFLIASVLTILIKTLYLAQKLCLPLSDMVDNILGAWWYFIYFIPLLLLQCIVLPNTFGYNVLSIFIFFVIILVLFVLVPSLIGVKYKNEVHGKLMQIAKIKLKRYKTRVG